MAHPHFAQGLNTAQALEQLDALYYQAVNALRDAIKAFVEEGKLPDPQARADGLFVYPELRISWDGASPQKSAAAPGGVSATRAVTRRPSPGRSCCATICASSSR